MRDMQIMGMPYRPSGACNSCAHDRSCPTCYDPPLTQFLSLASLHPITPFNTHTFQHTHTHIHTVTGNSSSASSSTRRPSTCGTASPGARNCWKRCAISATTSSSCRRRRSAGTGRPTRTWPARREPNACLPSGRRAPVPCGSWTARWRMLPTQAPRGLTRLNRGTGGLSVPSARPAPPRPGDEREEGSRKIAGKMSLRWLGSSPRQGRRARE